MKRINLIGLALTALFAFSAIAATAAYAEQPEFLFKTGGFPVKLGFTSGEGHLGSKLVEITCKKDHGSAEITSNTAGTFTVDFEECVITNTTTKCRSLGDANGTILVGGTLTPVTVTLPGGALGVGALLTVNTGGTPTLLHIECSVILALVGGSVIGEFLSVTSETEQLKKGTKKKLDIQLEGGKQQFTKCVTPKATCEGKTYELYVEVSKEREAATEETTEETEVTSSNEFAIDF